MHGNADALNAALDRVGLIALWREGLLAQKVLEGSTKGYINHPQLTRFKQSQNPLLSIGTYLYYVYLEGVNRGYRFNLNKIKVYNTSITGFIPITSGQIRYEYKLLLYKLSSRDPQWRKQIECIERIDVNPVFYIIEGSISEWEKPRDFLLRDEDSESIKYV
ncbi:MAG: pyrimidine dimer DNA glycosylase/endonuclease V [Ignisphaera sp.]|uniref:DNA lyase n=1 Tax=Ignisphaera aggregans TaxID=334771 RepID=A0A7J3MWS1_9CREN